jgi:ATP-dependent DNA helicase RecG
VDIELIRSWAALGESNTLEFKKSTAEKERACRTLCAFANGGVEKCCLG